MIERVACNAKNVSDFIAAALHSPTDRFELRRLKLDFRGNHNRQNPNRIPVAERLDYIQYSFLLHQHKNIITHHQPSTREIENPEGKKKKSTIEIMSGQIRFPSRSASKPAHSPMVFSFPGECSISSFHSSSKVSHSSLFFVFTTTNFRIQLRSYRRYESRVIEVL